MLWLTTEHLFMKMWCQVEQFGLHTDIHICTCISGGWLSLAEHKLHRIITQRRKTKQRGQSCTCLICCTVYQPLQKWKWCIRISFSHRSRRSSDTPSLVASWNHWSCPNNTPSSIIWKAHYEVKINNNTSIGKPLFFSGKFVCITVHFCGIKLLQDEQISMDESWAHFKLTKALQCMLNLKRAWFMSVVTARIRFQSKTADITIIFHQK